MRRDVSVSMAGLCGLAVAISVGCAVAGLQLVAVGVPLGLLCLLALAFVSPVGPVVLFDPPSKDMINGVGRDDD